MQKKMTAEELEALLRERLGRYWYRVGPLWALCENLRFDIGNVLLHAHNQGDDKVEEVLQELEKHYREDLRFQHPDFHGKGHKTAAFFEGICVRILGLAPSGT